MEEWLKQNAIAIVAICFSLAGFLWNLAKRDARADEHERKLVEVCKDIETLQSSVSKVSTDLAHHRENIDRHVDPNRDDRRWADLISRIDRIDRKLEQINAKP